MKLYYIRHAQSANNHLYLSQGSWLGRSDDPDLTELGYRQAARLAEFLAEAERSPNPIERFGLTHLYSSLHLRALHTGQAISRALDLPLTAWPDWHESGGIYQFDPAYFDSSLPEAELPRIGLPGKPRSYFEQRFPDLRLPEELDENGWWNRPFETRPQRAGRACRVLSELLARHGGTSDHVAVISHGSFFNYLLRAAMGMGENEINRPGYNGELWFMHYNCGISCLDFGEGEAVSTDSVTGEIQLVFQNRHEAMLPELITR